MYALLGNKLCEVTREDVAHTTCPVKVKQIETGFTPDYDCILMGDGTIDYHKVIDNMVHDDDRFKTVLNFNNDLPCDSPVMVLANRVEYLQNLCEAYDGIGKCLSGMGQSKKAKAERKDALNALNTGKINCVFATYQLAKE